MHQVSAGSEAFSGQFSRGTWCIANAINAFPGFLAPSLGRFRGNSPEGLGASPTQSMRFQTFLHQAPAASEVKSKKLHPESKLDDKWLYKFFWGLGGTYPFHCGVLTPYLYTCWGNKRPPKSMLSLTRGTHHNFDSIKRTEILTMSS